jgi:hypothetical protein
MNNYGISSGVLRTMLQDGLRLFKTFSPGIAWIVLPIFIPVELFDAFYTSRFIHESSSFSLYLPPMVLRFMAHALYKGALIFYLASIISGKMIGPKAAWALGIKFWPRMILLNLMVWISLTAGFVVMIAPGVYLLGRLAFAEFELLLNQRDPLDAMKASWAQSGSYVWIILGGYLIISVILYVPYYIPVALFHIRESDLGIMVNVIDIMYSFLSVTYTLFAFRVYHLYKEKQKLADVPFNPREGI